MQPPSERGITREGKEIPEGKTPILISGLPGKMATLVAEAISRSSEYTLIGSGLSSRNHFGTKVDIERKRITLVGTDYLQLSRSSPRRFFQLFGEGAIVVDYTTPTSVNSNAEHYIQAGLPFVMGTSVRIEDREKLIETVKNSEISAVIAPNMAPHLVLFQAMLDNAAQNFPGALNGYRLEIVESHQSTKKDPSGTGKAWQGLLENLGVGLTRDMESIRDPERQRKLGIKNPDGHGYHWLTIKNPDGTASIEIVTKVEGRNPYVKGTLMALKFLKQKIEAGSRGEVFSMIDVLRAQTEEK